MRNAPDLLLKRVDNHLRAYPLVTVLVETDLGPGRLVYATDDRWLGVQLDGEQRVDEYQPEQVRIARIAA